MSARSTDNFTKRGINSKEANAIKLLENELNMIKETPIRCVWVRPHPTNFLQWHFVIQGRDNTSYEGGYYHGKLFFSEDYPQKIPEFMFITPNGRFVIKKLLPGKFDFVSNKPIMHWTVRSFFQSLVFFWTKIFHIPGINTKTNSLVKKRFAAYSIVFNLRNDEFVTVFADKYDFLKRRMLVKLPLLRLKYFMQKRFLFDPTCNPKDIKPLLTAHDVIVDHQRQKRTMVFCVLLTIGSFLIGFYIDVLVAYLNEFLATFNSD